MGAATFCLGSMTVNGLEGRGFLLLIIGVELHSDSVVSYMLMGGSCKRKADGIHALNQQHWYNGRNQSTSSHF